MKVEKGAERRLSEKSPNAIHREGIEEGGLGRKMDEKSEGEELPEPAKERGTETGRFVRGTARYVREKENSLITPT